MTTNLERQALIAKIRQLPGQLETLVRPLSEAQLNTRFLPNEWTVAQNIHHLADSHMNCLIRIKLILTEEHPTLRPYDQDAWAVTPDYAAPIEDSLTLLRGLHARWALLFESLGEAEWSRTGFHPDNGVVTLDGLLQAYADHGEGHLDQIRRTLAAEERSATA